MAPFEMHFVQCSDSPRQHGTALLVHLPGFWHRFRSPALATCRGCAKPASPSATPLVTSTGRLTSYRQARNPWLPVWARQDATRTRILPLQPLACARPEQSGRTRPQDAPLSTQALQKRVCWSSKAYAGDCLPVRASWKHRRRERWTWNGSPRIYAKG